MHVFTTSRAGPDPFAVASTYIESAKMTLAIMIGCSARQVDKVQESINCTEDAIRHPLLILGICTELQLKRLESLVEDRALSCFRTMRKFEEANRLGPNRKYNGDIPKLISDVCYSREAIKIASDEIKATKRQLIKALPSSLNSAMNLFDTDDGNPTNLQESETDKSKELTNRFYQQFTDIFTRFEDLVAKCEVASDAMSFSAGIVSPAWQLLQTLIIC
jgi:hypothetical protein